MSSPLPSLATSGKLLSLLGTHWQSEYPNSRIHSNQPLANSATSLDSNHRVCFISLKIYFGNILAEIKSTYKIRSPVGKDKYHLKSPPVLRLKVTFHPLLIY